MVDWHALTTEEADRLALEQEHRRTPVARSPQPGRGHVLRRSLAWITVWATAAFLIWQALPEYG